ncbi:MAG: ribonuclease R family protein [Acholeplasmataceae bacterium]
MIQNDLLTKILIFFYEHEGQNFELDFLFDELGITFDDLKTIDSFKKYFYLHNEQLKLHPNLRVGKISKGKVADYLKCYDDSYRLTFRTQTLNGDIILMNMISEIILLYLARETTHVIATVDQSKRGKTYYILEDIEQFHLELNEAPQLMKGEIIYVLIDNVVDNKITGTYLKTIGHINDPDIEMLKIIYKHDWPTDFSEEVINEARNIKIDYQDERKKRLDLTRILTFTIDGANAKDLDDAISFKQLNDSYEVGIHIADIGYLVKEGSLIDMEAQNRATSLYVVNKVIPMLPVQISNGVGSLNENEEKLTLSVIFKISKDFNVLDYKLEKTIIKSDFRLTYDEVNSLFYDNEFQHSNELKAALLFLYEFSKVLFDKSKKAGSIDFESTELEFVVDGEEVIDVFKRESRDAERLIEALMILANETVATHLNNLNYPSVYRIHEAPDFEKLQESIKMISKLGFKSNLKDYKNPKNIARLVNMANNTRYRHIVSQLVLKSMKRAVYTPYREIHYGLGLQCYTHFTAPIRRYPDLILHRLINDLLFDKSNFEKKFNYYDQILPEILKHSSQQERVAIEIERDIEKLYSIKYLNQNFDKIYKGQIVSILPSGMFIALQNGIEGFCPLRTLDTYFYYYEETLNYINDYGVEYKLGDFVLVEYIGYDVSRLEIDFKIIKKV